MSQSMRINSISTGFIDIPDQISLNIYAQGCKKRCNGCQNPDLQDFNGGKLLNISDIDSLLSDYSLCGWVCWLGGDAIYQEESLIEFNKEFKKRGLRIALYTGLEFEELSESVLETLDLVVDGEWIGIPVTDNTTNQSIWYRISEGKYGWSLLNGWGMLKLMDKELITINELIEGV